MANKGKSHKSTAKRFKLTKGGKVVHQKQGNNNHYMTKMSVQQKRRVEGLAVISSRKQAKKLIQLGNL